MLISFLVSINFIIINTIIIMNIIITTTVITIITVINYNCHDHHFKPRSWISPRQSLSAARIFECYLWLGSSNAKFILFYSLINVA